jgi:putative transposase
MAKDYTRRAYTATTSGFTASRRSGTSSSGEGKQFGRDRVARLMDELELESVVRGKRTRTTLPAEVSARPPDLVDRKFTAAAPNALWVADLTYVSTWSGFCYVAFVVDVFSRAPRGAMFPRGLRDPPLAAAAVGRS